MGAKELVVILAHLDKMPAKSRRWSIPLFGYILDLYVANSWLVYKRECGLVKQEAMSLKRFRLAVAHSLNQVNKTLSRGWLTIIELSTATEERPETPNHNQMCATTMWDTGLFTPIQPLSKGSVKVEMSEMQCFPVFGLKSETLCSK